MKKKKSKDEMSQDIRNFVAKHMNSIGNCGLQIVEDKKREMKNGEGKHRFNKNTISRDH